MKSQQHSIISLIISDLDGTLIDTTKANTAAYRRAFADSGVELTQKHEKQMYGLRFDAFAQFIAPDLTNEELQIIRERKKQYYPEYFAEMGVNTRLIIFLRFMKQQGVRIAIATTATRVNGMEVLKAHGIDDIADYVVFGDEVEYGKPNPECFMKCMEWAGTTPEQTLIIEDSEAGTKAAQASGAAVLRITQEWS